MAVLFAFCCLALTALNDLLFRFFARKPRSRGIFVTVIGMIWFCVAIWDVRGIASINWTATLFWGSITGFFSVAGNLLLLEAMGHLSAGTCSTLYRLNLVPVVLGATLFLGEKVSLLQWGGIGFALLAVLLFLPVRQDEKPTGVSRKIILAALAMAVLAAFCRAEMGLGYRYAFLHEADRA